LPGRAQRKGQREESQRDYLDRTSFHLILFLESCVADFAQPNRDRSLKNFIDLRRAWS
jgi:hypothetical protein